MDNKMDNQEEIRLRLVRPDTSTHTELPVATSGVSAGFPSPADDHLDPPLDLNRELVRNPGATFFARVAGDSMQDDGIADGDLLVVDKSLEAYDGCVAVCFLDGEFTLKRLGWDRARSSSCPRTSATNRSRSARKAIFRYGAW